MNLGQVQEGSVDSAKRIILKKAPQPTINIAANTIAVTEPAPTNQQPQTTNQPEVPENRTDNSSNTSAKYPNREIDVVTSPSGKIL